jgi:hypothetical protein
MKNEIKSLIATSKVKKAIALISRHYANNNLEAPNELTLLSSRYNTNQSMHNSSLISFEQFKKEEAMINNALLNMVDSLEDMIESSTLSNENNKNGLKCLLFVAGANPPSSKMNLPGEYLEIRKIFKPFDHKYRVTEEFDATLDDFFDAIKSDCPNILHFSGLGKEDGIYLVNPRSLKQEYISNDFLASALRMADDNLECVFLASANSMDLAKKISNFVPYAVGAYGCITDEQAIKFSSAFYSSLALNDDCEAAFKNGMKMIQAVNPSAGNRHSGSQSDGQEAEFVLFKKGDVSVAT